MSTNVLVVIGAGSIGLAIARRTGAGKHVLLADFNETNLQNAKTAREAAAPPASTRGAGVPAAGWGGARPRAAAALGDVARVVSPAGVSPVQAPAEAVLAVDLYGTA